MSKPSKRELCEARGRSILDAEHTEVMVSELLTTKPYINNELDDNVVASLKVLYPYMLDAPDKIMPKGSLQDLVSDFRHNIFPEGDIFFWQKQVLCTLHALQLWFSAGFRLQRPKPPRADSLRQRVTKKRYFNFPKEMRVHFHEIVFQISLLDCERCASDCTGGFCIADAMNEVEEQCKEDGLRIQKQGARRFARVFGAMCDFCKSVGKGKMACSRCHKVFYCDRDCQKAQWPQHKKVCGRIHPESQRSTAPCVN